LNAGEDNYSIKRMKNNEDVRTISQNASKALVALNSGAFFALIHFLTKKEASQALDSLFIHPAYLFSFGLTSILAFALCEYIRSEFLKCDNTLSFWISFILSVSSAISFLSGVWLIACALASEQSSPLL